MGKDKEIRQVRASDSVEEEEYCEIRSKQLQLQQLYTFRRVVELGGYSGAAGELNLSVASVWQHIRSLEQQYDTKLFAKEGRTVRPTDDGRQLYQSIGEPLASLEATFDRIGRGCADQQTTTIVAAVRLMVEDLARPLALFQKDASQRFLIKQGNDKRAVALLLSGAADIAFCLEPGVDQASDDIHYEPLYFVDFLAIAPKRHDLAKQEDISLADIVQHPLVVTSKGTHGRDALDQALMRERLQASIAVEADNSAFTIACVRSGLGVGVLAGRPGGELCKGLFTHSLESELGRRQIVCMWRKGRKPTEAQRSLIDTIQASYKN